MDSVTSSEEGHWAEIKELKKNKRYGMHIYFINYLSSLHGRPWNCTQANFTVRALGFLKKTQFQDRLCLLGVTNSKARDKIRMLTMSETLASPDIILKLFHVSICWYFEKNENRAALPGETGPFKGPQLKLTDPYRSPTRGSSIPIRPLNEGPHHPLRFGRRGCCFTRVKVPNLTGTATITEQ